MRPGSGTDVHAVTLHGVAMDAMVKALGGRSILLSFSRGLQGAGRGTEENMSHRFDCEVVGELDKFAGRVAAWLCKAPCYEVSYPDGCNSENWPVDEIWKLNQETFSRVRNCGNVYAIFVGNGATWSFRYIGKSKPESLGGRLRQHFIGPQPEAKCPPHSKHVEIKQAVCERQRVGFSCVDVRPGELNVYVEAWIQRTRKPEWNERDEAGG